MILDEVLMTRHTLPLTLAALTAIGCAAPKKEVVLNSPPANDPIRVVDDSPELDNQMLSEDPATRRQEILARCYMRALMNGQIATTRTRTHVTLLSAHAIGGELDAHFTPRSQTDLLTFQTCVARSIEAGTFQVPTRGVFVTHAVEATRTPTPEGEVIDIVPMPLSVGKISKAEAASALTRESDTVKTCKEGLNNITDTPPFSVLVRMNVAPNGEVDNIRVHSTWGEVPIAFLDCVRGASNRLSFASAPEGATREVRHVISVEQ
jgi:hypothetical protein